jgi:hypothetical protein
MNERVDIRIDFGDAAVRVESLERESLKVHIS